MKEGSLLFTYFYTKELVFGKKVERERRVERESERERRERVLSLI
jgi:hypothetical protein